LGTGTISAGIYVYSIIESHEPRSFGNIGIGWRGDEVFSVHYRDLAALVSRSPLVVYEPNRENALAHEHVNEVAKLEFGFKVNWNRDEILAEVEHANEDIRCLKEEIVKNQQSSTYFARMQLGRMVEQALADTFDRQVQDIAQRFEGKLNFRYTGQMRRLRDIKTPKREQQQEPPPRLTSPRDAAQADHRRAEAQRLADLLAADERVVEARHSLCPSDEIGVSSALLAGEAAALAMANDCGTFGKASVYWSMARGRRTALSPWRVEPGGRHPRLGGQCQAADPLAGVLDRQARTDRPQQVAVRSVAGGWRSGRYGRWGSGIWEAAFWRWSASSAARVTPPPAPRRRRRR
jgi:Gas vesicle synthesis protein GvpL/GvpF